MGATATEVGDDELERAVSVFSDRSLRHGEGAVGRADVRAPAEHRLYRATAHEVFILGDRTSGSRWIWVEGRPAD